MAETQEFIPTREQVDAALATEEPPEELAILTTEAEKEIGAKILPALTAKVRAIAQAEAAKELAKLTQELRAQNERMMKEEVDKLRASIKPPDPKELEQLLSQEYGTMDMALATRVGTKRTFTLRELPQAREKALFNIVQSRILPHLKELAAVEWTTTTTQADKLQKALTIIPDGLDMLAECCVICLDPYKEEGIDLDWVQSNMGSKRILDVVTAQFEISKIRDFASAAYALVAK